ncbi:SINGLE MYB HISTONE 4 [Salix purpurea]|uniref:MYB transcription factor n=1 Tax=Salix purpurea TaxID=77065 RepID=A0A9Q1A1V8_SALPP|nr:SINGLE MYB HISTONE 4 [Salix purpurea]
MIDSIDSWCVWGVYLLARLMGAPKQKWTAEEEAALKAGVIKHGAGKWRTILKDPEFSAVLYLRSNVDLKDKWRNISVMVNGYGSREKPKLAPKMVHHVLRQDEYPMAVGQTGEDISDAKPLAVSSGALLVANPKRTTVRLDNLIMEAITSLKEPGGSHKTAIAAYIEEQYWPPNDFKRILSAKLKYLAANGKLIKVKRKYKTAPTSVYAERRRVSPLILEGRQRISPKIERDGFNMLTMSQIDLDLGRMRTMTAEQVTEVAARAVAEAEAAIAVAEEATREAETAEAEAEAAQAFAKAARKTLIGRTTPKMAIQC